MQASKVVVAGAGSIGCFVGGQLAAAGHPVAFLARPRIADDLREHGLTLTARDGARAHVDAAALQIGADPGVLGAADVVLVTVKSGATAEMAETILAHAPAHAIVVSLQNGVDNAAILQRALPAMQVVAGMVAFNVVALGNGRFHRGSDGDIVIDAKAAALARELTTPQLRFRTADDMASVAWGKLLLNLNNALNALAGIPLREELADRGWRRVFAACMDEALTALRAAAIRPTKVGALPAAWLPTVLRLPDALFRIAAASQLKIDAHARTSMADDLEMRRTTEVDQLQGAVVALATAQRTEAPVNRAVLELVKQAERQGTGSPRLRPLDLGIPLPQ